MSVQDCKLKMKEQLKDAGLDRKIGPALLDSWARQFDSEAKGSLTKAEFQAKLSDFVSTKIAREQAKVRAAKLFTQSISLDGSDSVINNIKQWDADFAAGKRGVLFKDNPDNLPFEATRAWAQGGSIRAGESSNISVERSRTAIYDRLADQWHSSIHDLKEIAANGKIDNGFFQEVDAIDRGTTRGLSKSPEAEAYAKAFVALRDKIFSLKQAMNPFLEKAQNYLMQQFHDQEKTAAMPKDVWVKKMMDRAGDKSFPDADPKEKPGIFRDVYDRIVNGTYGGTVHDESQSREGGRNIFNSQSQGRQIIFNDWKASYEHFSELGPGTVYDGAMRMIHRASKDIAVLDKAGPRPAETFNQITNRVLDSLEGERKQIYEDQIPELKKIFNAAVLGTQDAPARGKLAAVTKGVMTQQYLAKVGGIYHAIQDPLLAISLLRDMNGRTFMGNAFDIVGGYMKGMAPFLGPDHVKEVMGNLGLFWKSGYSELMNAMGSADGQPGGVTRLIQKMGSLNLYQRHVDAMRSATATVLSKLLGEHADVDHAQLTDRMQRGLLRYGIGEHEWNIIRQTGGEQLYGHNLLLPENVEGMSDAAAEVYLRKSGQYDGPGSPSRQTLDRARFNLSRLLGTMINDHADMSSALPDARQKYFMWGDHTINTPRGALLRIISQFKGASLVTNDIYRRGYMSGDAPKGDYAGLFQHAITGMMFAGLAEYAKQFIEQGKTPEDPTNPAFVAKMAASSGFSGMFVDSMLGAAQRGGNSNIALSMLSNFFAGPAIGTLGETAGVVLQAAKEAGGAKHDRTLGPTAVSLLQGNIPLQNLWATRAVANFYLWNQLREFMGPGYLSHLAGRTEQTAGLLDKNQRYLWAKPTDRPLDHSFAGIGE